VKIIIAANFGLRKRPDLNNCFIFFGSDWATYRLGLPSPEQRLSGGHASGRWWRPSGVNRTAAIELKPFPALLFALFGGGTAADLA